jgi:hypothetical protein
MKKWYHHIIITIIIIIIIIIVKYGIIVLVLFPFAAIFACGYLFAKHRLGYTQAATKETEMVSHTSV